MVNQYLIDYYRIAFLSTKQKVTMGKLNLAKPVLLLSVMSAIKNGLLADNKIYYQIVKPIYEELIQEVQDESTPIKYPFYHLKSDGFWKLEWKSGVTQIPASPSDKFLRENLAYSMFDQELWDLLQDGDTLLYYQNAITSYFKMKIKN